MKKTSLFIGILAMMFVALIMLGCGGGGSGDGDKKPDDANPPVIKPSNDVPTASDLRRCTLCDDGIDLLGSNNWLGEKFGDKVFYVVIRAEKETYPREIYVGGIVNGKFVIHNQRMFADDVTPTILGNLFGVAFYKFDAIEKVNPKDSADIEAVGLMKMVPFRKDLINPLEVGSNSKCGNPYPISNKNWENEFPAGALFYAFDPEKEKVKFNKKGVAEVLTFDCQRELLAEKRLEAQSLLPLGPRIETTDGTIGGEIINANPPARTSIAPPVIDPPVVNPPVVDPPIVDPPVVDPPPVIDPPVVDPPVVLPDPVLLNCQNNLYLVDPDNKVAYNFQDSLEIGKLFAEVNLTNPATGECKLKINLKVTEVKILTIRCWKVYIPANWKIGDGNPIDLNSLNLGFSFSDQYTPLNGGNIDTIWVGVVSSTCYSSYTVGSKNWQSYIQELTVFIEVNKLHIDGIHKIKMNVRYGNTVYTFDCLRDAKEHRPWSVAVLAEHVTGYNLTFQGIPTDAYRTEDTVWLAVSSDQKPTSMK